MEVDYQPSFVDGIGGKSVLPEMWELVSGLLDGALLASLEEVADSDTAVGGTAAGDRGRARARRRWRRRWRDGLAKGKVVCVVSGGNIDREVLAGILSPRPHMSDREGITPRRWGRVTRGCLE